MNKTVIAVDSFKCSLNTFRERLAKNKESELCKIEKMILYIDAM